MAVFIYMSRGCWSDGHVHQGQDVLQDALGGLGRSLGHRSPCIDDHTVRENGYHQPFDVVRKDLVPAFDERERLAGAVQSLGSAGADAQREGLVISGPFDDREHVVDEGVVDPDLLGRILDARSVLRRVSAGCDARFGWPGGVPQDLAFGGGSG